MSGVNDGGGLARDDSGEHEGEQVRFEGAGVGMCKEWDGGGGCGGCGGCDGAPWRGEGERRREGHVEQLARDGREGGRRDGVERVGGEWREGGGGPWVGETSQRREGDGAGDGAGKTCRLAVTALVLALDVLAGLVLAKTVAARGQVLGAALLQPAAAHAGVLVVREGRERRREHAHGAVAGGRGYG